jgi:hypothetical protein
MTYPACLNCDLYAGYAELPTFDQNATVDCSTVDCWLLSTFEREDTPIEDDDERDDASVRAPRHQRNGIPDVQLQNRLTAGKWH